MLLALMSGKALTATELSLEADITAQTASSHLSKLVSGGLLIVRKQGRHKYFQLRDHQVADLVESLLTLSNQRQAKQIATGPKDPHLKYARACYDHLAGTLAVDLYNSLVNKLVLIDHNHTTILSDSGRKFFTGLGANFDELEKSQRPLCKSCLDWSERKTHLGGNLGKWILEELLSQGWAVREPDSRIIRFTNSGLTQFKSRYQIVA